VEKNRLNQINEILFGSSDTSISKQISRLVREKRIRKIAPRLYTSNFHDRPEEIVKRNLFFIVGHLFSGAVLSHRSAFEFHPTSSGHLFLTYKYTRNIRLPGITIALLEGHGPTEKDSPFLEGLFVSQPARAFLENLQVTRKTGTNSKTLRLEEIEERLDQIIRIHGEDKINELRDEARDLSITLEMEKEFKKLHSIIAALLTTKSSRSLTSPVAAARALGIPYDPDRLELFEILFRELNQQEFITRIDENKSKKSFQNFAFFESYFSNYIEGTVFRVEDAQKIIASQKPLPARNADSHDVLGTYMIVSNKKTMKEIPSTGEHLIRLLKDRHKILMHARNNIEPGTFKDKNNFAGNTAFVDFRLVYGTLLKSFDYYRVLRAPFAKAAFMMFVVSEVHPFLDGNGRIARIMMNAELVHASQTKIIIPTVYREDYLGALRKLTRQRKPKAYIRMLSKAQEFSAGITGISMFDMQSRLEASNAFLEHTEGKMKIIG